MLNGMRVLVDVATDATGRTGGLRVALRSVLQWDSLLGIAGSRGASSTGGLPELTTRAVATRRECSQEDSLDKEGD